MSSDVRLRAFAAGVRAVVLVGGKSRRFGRDKLVERVGELEDGEEELLVDRPLGALREVFGTRVEAVGACDPRVAARFDGMVVDRYPGAGPVGGIVSALDAGDGPVFVLAGDMPDVHSASVRRIVERAVELEAAGTVVVAVLAAGGTAGTAAEVEPCFGLYFPIAAELLRPRGVGGEKIAGLRERLRGLTVDAVAVDPRELINVNRPEDWTPRRV
jgi:molybdopterin-guanine dinucleotide biosynthesis protein A